MPEFQRPQDGFRFIFGGVNTKEVPDALGSNKYQAAQNVRATAEQSIRTRPGYSILFTANNNQSANNFTPTVITDMRAYTTLNNNAFPRILARDGNGRVFLDNGLLVGNLSGNAGYGVSMVPFRPRESATPWMYISGLADYQRFSAPNANNNVVQNKVGIAEPQNQVEAAPQAPLWTPFAGAFGSWNNSGNAGAVVSGTRSNDTSIACVADPVSPYRFYVEVGNANAPYSAGELLMVNNNSALTPIVQEVFPVMSGSLTIRGIRYNSGNNGLCSVFIDNVPTTETPLSVLRRGSLLNLSGSNGNETVVVLGTAMGRNSSFAFDVSTTITFAVGDTVSGRRALCMDYPLFTFTPGLPLTATYIGANVTTGLGYLSRAFNNATNPFGPLVLAGNGALPQQDDYFHGSFWFSNPENLIELLIEFNVSANSNDFSQDLYYYAVRPGDIVNVPLGSQTQLGAILSSAENLLISQLPTAADGNNNIAPSAETVAGANQWTEVMVPISAFTRVGGDQSRSLANCSGMRFQVNASGNTTFFFSSLWIGGGGQPDIGNNGEPYRYLCVPMNSNTGVPGNPTPPMRYGVSPRRQSTLVKTSSLNNNYDPQIDTWMVYRYGGSVLSYRLIGSVTTGSDFTDTFFDDTAAAGAPVVIDNTEAWPTIDQPWAMNGNANACGPWLDVAATNLPASMNRWLPGTLFQVGSSQDVFTLRSRPVISGNNAKVEFEQCIGAGNQNRVYVLEPAVAAQAMPYVWGPNEYGHMFGCGDPYRPAVVSWAKKFSPDAVATKNNLELCQPSEPLLGGEVIRGVSLCASSKRWWYLNFQSGSDQQQYVQVEAPVGKRLAAPYGKTTDGTSIFFWAEDCIAKTEGAAAESLTDEDLYNIFPHGGTAGVDVVSNGVTYYAPDYSRLAQFRLVFRLGLLLAFYLDSSGTRRVLVYDTLRKAWSSDAYAHSMSTGYNIEQPEASLQGTQTLYPGLLLGDTAGHIWKVQDLTNDGVTAAAPQGTPISGVVATREYNAGDARTNEQWGDVFLDVNAPFGLNATPVVQGQPIQDANNNNIVTVVAADGNRQFVPVSVGGATFQSFLGLRLNWIDDYTAGNQPTKLNVWQPSYVDKPETTTNRYGNTVDFGQASYVRGATIYADTMGSNKSVMIRNMDNNALVPLQSVASNNNSASIINHNGEQEINYWFNPPFVAHMVRHESQDSVPWRLFKIEYLKDAWPELTDLPSPWMSVRDTGQAGFLQGLILPLEVGDANNNTAPSLKLRVDSSSSLIDLVPHVDPLFNFKTGVAYSLATPVVCHQAQIIPQEPCRVWWSEIQWKAEQTPDLATTWKTQWTGFGIGGFKHIPRIEFAYSSQADVNLVIESSDGTQPVSVLVPSSGGVQSKVYLTLTFNKGLLYRFSGTSSAAFQIFMEDCKVWVCEWGRLGAAAPYSLGAEFGDKATI